jgi:integral membrane sensor domain MASE1
LAAGCTESRHDTSITDTLNLPISTNGLAGAATAAGNTLAPLVAATLLSRIGFHRQIDRLRDATAIVFVGALLSMSISASVGTGTLVRMQRRISNGNGSDS